MTAQLIDESVLEQLTKDVGSELIPMLVMAFVDECNKFHQVLTQLSLPADAVAISRVCHSLKSSCATYGAVEAGKLARELEQQCKQQDFAKAQQQLDQLLPLLRSSLSQLRLLTNC